MKSGYTDWRVDVAEFAAQRLGLDPGDLRPQAVAYTALGAALAAYEHWLANPASDLGEILDQAYRDLERGFS